MSFWAAMTLAKNWPDHNEQRLCLMSGKTVVTKSSVTGGKPFSLRIPDWKAQRGQVLNLESFGKWNNSRWVCSLLNLPQHIETEGFNLICWALGERHGKGVKHDKYWDVISRRENDSDIPAIDLILAPCHL